MAHCPVELLDDLGDLLAEVRGWAGVKEPQYREKRGDA
jgi:hypothetical protein